MQKRKKASGSGSTGPSRNGHEYHDTWAARMSLQLLLPGGNLAGIAMEGFEIEDQAKVSKSAAEIADLTLYYGHAPFERSEKTVVVQLKYSVSRATHGVRANEIKKTIEKFTITFHDFVKAYGVAAVEEKLSFEFITNRPISQGLLEATQALAGSREVSGDAKKQADQLASAAKLDEKHLKHFAAKLSFSGGGGSLRYNKQALSMLVVNWSATNDAIAKARLGDLKELIRDKAAAQQGKSNVVFQTDILHVLGVSHKEELLPSSIKRPETGKVVEREQLLEAVQLILMLQTPLVIHATGGMGKTVFMDSIASALKDTHEVVFFDCFGGGAYRYPHDARHLPRNGLMQIANTLAFRGLCDPILPGSATTDSLIRAFRRRLEQCVQASAQIDSNRQLILLVDAIDNAQAHAQDNGEEAFPDLLLATLKSSPISGVKLVVSCRPERRPESANDCKDFPLKGFTLKETAAYLSERVKDITQAEIQVAQARSQGNPRVLAYLIKSGRRVLCASETEKLIELDALIQERVDAALREAKHQGYQQEKIDIFLSGLAALPPPIPVEEYASALEMDASAVESFATDLCPLLEKTRHGLMFRDEPTETFIRKNYSGSIGLLNEVAKKLNQQQSNSVYAARALPGLLQKLNDGEALFKLALDAPLPASISSAVGQTSIRYARLRAALSHAARVHDYDRLVSLLVELSTIAAVDERGSEYIVQYPDLVVAANDLDSIRMLFEIRTTWPGSRHARLTIVNTLLANVSEAYHHAILTEDWLHHEYRNPRESFELDSGPTLTDCAAIPFFLIAHGDPGTACDFLKQWRHPYVFEIVGKICGLIECAEALGISLANRTETFLSKVSEKDPGILAAMLSFKTFEKGTNNKLLSSLAKASMPTEGFRDELTDRHVSAKMQDGLHLAAALALQAGKKSQALSISALAPHDRYRVRAVSAQYLVADIFSYVYFSIIQSIAENRTIHELDILPKELHELFPSLERSVTGESFNELLKKSYEKHVSSEKEKKQKLQDTGEWREHEHREIEKFINIVLTPLFELTDAFRKLLTSPPCLVDKELLDFLDVWESVRSKRDNYGDPLAQLSLLGKRMAIFAIWSRTSLQRASIEEYFIRASKYGLLDADSLIRVISFLAKRPALHEFAGEKALTAVELIKGEVEVTQRSQLFGALARAILPASISEATGYFRQAIAQMDAIGSGDYSYANELLHFASTMKGKELTEQDFHTLANISELNLWDEPSKFDWGSYGRGLSVASGTRGLAKICRLSDRGQAPLDYSLLPNLTGLVKSGKLSPAYAVPLSRLASPYELHVCDTSDFVEAVCSEAEGDKAILISEAIEQYKQNSRGKPSPSILNKLKTITTSIFGENSTVTNELASMAVHMRDAYDQKNKHTNLHSRSERNNNEDKKLLQSVNRIIKKTLPTNRLSLEDAFSQHSDLRAAWKTRDPFFAGVRARVPYSERQKYVDLIVTSDVLSFYEILSELNACKKAWENSSQSIGIHIKQAAFRLFGTHSNDFVSDKRLCGLPLDELQTLSEASYKDIAIELVKELTRPNLVIPGPVWLALAAHICPHASKDVGQSALTRLLRNPTAQLSSSVLDGPWVPGMYPNNGNVEISAGLVWFVLGAREAGARWRAAHSICSLAKLGHWDVVDALVARLDMTDAGPFQQKNYKFFFLHARLWLLISLARVAKDFPMQVARYKEVLLKYALNPEIPHVLMRHFASATLTTLVERNAIGLNEREHVALKSVNVSPFPVEAERLRRDDSYSTNSKEYKKPEDEFRFDYDFRKHEADSLGRLFGQHTWAICNSIADTIRSIDPSVNSMYDDGGRRQPPRDGRYTEKLGYGEYLAWHSLFIVAENLLKTKKICKTWADETPWNYWFDTFTLTRNDGYWLSDGTDQIPVNLIQNLLEESAEKVVLTGDHQRLRRLIFVGAPEVKEIAIYGHWESFDGVSVGIVSALFKPKIVHKVIRSLLEEKPFSVGLPHYDDEYRYGNVKDFEGIPIVVTPDFSHGIDVSDPFGSSYVGARARLRDDYAAGLGLIQSEIHGRTWSDQNGQFGTRSEVWGDNHSYGEDSNQAGQRLLLSDKTLLALLGNTKLELLILIKLQRYEKAWGRKNSKYTHTIGVLHIDRELKHKLHLGHINYESLL